MKWSNVNCAKKTCTQGSLKRHLLIHTGDKHLELSVRDTHVISFSPC